MDFSYDKSNSLGQSMSLDRDSYGDINNFYEKYYHFEVSDEDEDQYEYEEREFIKTQDDEDLEETIKEFGKYLFIIEMKRFKSSYDFLKYDGNYGNLLDLIDYFNFLMRKRSGIKNILEDIKYVAEMDENYDKRRFNDIVSLMY